jgi:hypothetical protein
VSDGGAIRHLASLWTLQDRRWSAERLAAEIAGGGFGGVVGELTPVLARAARRGGLALLGFVEARDRRAALERLRAQIDCGATGVNFLYGDPMMKPERAAADWVAIESAAEGVGVSLETHRDRCTETPEKIVAIARHYRKITGATLRLTLDFSHLAVARVVPVARMAEMLPRTLRSAATQVHVRPYNQHHAQLPLRGAAGALWPETRSYLEAVVPFISQWCGERENRARVLDLCPELGPRRSGYCLSAFSDPWSDAVALRRELARRLEGPL